MQNETQRIADQLRLAYVGPAWHGPSLREILADLTEADANRRPIPNAHTIHEILQHIATWMRIGRERLSATEIRMVSSEEDWPAALPAWDVTLARLDAEQRALEQAIVQFPVERLQQRAPAEEPQTYYVLLHGLVQHNLYHAGQVMLLKRC